MFYWFEPVLDLYPVSKFQFSEIAERPRYFVGFADNLGDSLTLKILKNDLVTVLHRIVDRCWRYIPHVHLILGISLKLSNRDNLQIYGKEFSST
jgi:hypothetical protein